MKKISENWNAVLLSRHYILIALMALSLGPTAPALTLMTWNVSGNGAADWSTNAPQVQAIGRQVAAKGFLRPVQPYFPDAIPKLLQRRCAER